MTSVEKFEKSNPKTANALNELSYEMKGKPVMTEKQYSILSDILVSYTNLSDEEIARKLGELPSN